MIIGAERQSEQVAEDQARIAGLEKTCAEKQVSPSRDLDHVSRT